MLTKTLSPKTGRRAGQVIGLAAGVAAIATLYLVVHPDNASTANGIVIGGLVALAGATIAFLRGGRASATSLERSMSGHADERDVEVTRRALAFAGATSLVWMTGALIAVVMGARPEIPLAIMLWGQLLSLVAGWWWANRRL